MTEPVSQMRGSIKELNPCPKTFSIGDELTFLLCNQKDASYIPYCVCERENFENSHPDHMLCCGSDEETVEDEQMYA